MVRKERGARRALMTHSEMSSYDIAVIRGDGIGKEVVEEGLKALDAVGSSEDISWNFTEFPWGSDYYLEHGMMLPGDGVDQLASFDAIFLGAVGHPKIQDHITLNGLLLPIRRTFDQYVCERPSILYPGVDSPLAGKKPYDIDLVVIQREHRGGVRQRGRLPVPGVPGGGGGPGLRVFTRRGTERVVDYAFQLAQAAQQGKEGRVDHKVERNGLRDGVVGPDVRRGQGAIPRRRDRLDVDRPGVHGDDPRAGAVRRNRGIQPFRRHPYRHRRDGHRQHGPGAERQSESRRAMGRRCSNRRTARRPT